MTIEGLIARKVGMTTLYWEDGRTDGVTLLEAGPCYVTQIRTHARDGYEAVQVGFQDVKHLNKPRAGHLARSGGRFRHLQEFKVDDLSDYEVGQIVKASVFSQGDTVTVRGVSRGRGFAGGVQRHGFSGGPKTHGQSDRHRAPGSIGAGSSPGRVWKGTHMAGHYGAANVTAKGLKIALVDEDRNIIAVRGAVPGPKNGIVRIQLERRGEPYETAILFGILPIDEEAPAPEQPEEAATDAAEAAAAVEAEAAEEAAAAEAGAPEAEATDEAAAQEPATEAEEPEAAAEEGPAGEPEPESETETEETPAEEAPEDEAADAPEEPPADSDDEEQPADDGEEPEEPSEEEAPAGDDEDKETAS